MPPRLRRKKAAAPAQPEVLDEYPTTEAGWQRLVEAKKQHEGELERLAEAHRRHHIQNLRRSTAAAEGRELEEVFSPGDPALEQFTEAIRQRSAQTFREDWGRMAVGGAERVRAILAQRAQAAAALLDQRQDDDPRWLSSAYIAIAEGLEEPQTLEPATRTLLAHKWVEAARRVRAALEREGARFVRAEKRWDFPMPASARDQRRSPEVRGRSLRAWKDRVEAMRLTDLDRHPNPVWFQGLRGRKGLRALPSRGPAPSGLGGMRDSQAARYLESADRALTQAGKAFKRKQCRGRDFSAASALHYAAMAQAELRWLGGTEYRRAVELARSAAALLVLPCAVPPKVLKTKTPKKKPKRST